MSKFFLYMLSIAVIGHVVIAIIRMCGFNALRNAHRPLTSKSVADFWNRVFYYYKELLVAFFFYPAFFRYFKKRPVLRMYCATMSAAFLGNFLYHFMHDIWYVIDLGFFQSLVSFQSFFVYCFVLGNTIFISQLFQKKNTPSELGLFSRLVIPVRVLGFYCLLNIFGTYQRETVFDNMLFLLSLLPFPAG